MEPQVRTPDPEETARVLQQVAERSAKILGEYAGKNVASSLSAATGDELGIAKAYMDLYSRLAVDPSLVASLSVNWWLDAMRLWQSSWLKAAGVEAPPVAEPAKSDARFKDADWSTNFLFDYIKQSYLIAARHIQHAVSSVHGLPEESEKKVAFSRRP